MNKLTALFPIFAYLAILVFSFIAVIQPSSVLADHPCASGLVRDANNPHGCNVNLRVSPPEDVGINAASPSDVLTNALRIIFFMAALAVLFMLIIGAFQWITSGGDKDAVGKARSRIVAALVGLAILALAVLIVRIVGGILNINVFDVVIPSLNSVSTPTNP